MVSGPRRGFVLARLPRVGARQNHRRDLRFGSIPAMTGDAADLRRRSEVERTRSMGLRPVLRSSRHRRRGRRRGTAAVGTFRMKCPKPASVHDLLACRQGHFDCFWRAILRGRRRDDRAEASLEHGFALWRELRTAKSWLAHPRLMAHVHAADQVASGKCDLTNDNNSPHEISKVLVDFIWFGLREHCGHGYSAHCCEHRHH
jgi:hypothetical protein